MEIELACSLLAVALLCSPDASHAQVAWKGVGTILAKEGEVVAVNKRLGETPVSAFSVLEDGMTLRFGMNARAKLVHDKEGATYVISGLAVVTVSQEGIAVDRSSAILSKTSAKLPVELAGPGGAPAKGTPWYVRLGGVSLSKTLAGLTAEQPVVARPLPSPEKAAPDASRQAEEEKRRIENERRQADAEAERQKQIEAAKSSGDEKEVRRLADEAKRAKAEDDKKKVAAEAQAKAAANAQGKAAADAQAKAAADAQAKAAADAQAKAAADAQGKAAADAQAKAAADARAKSAADAQAKSAADAKAAADANAAKSVSTASREENFNQAVALEGTNMKEAVRLYRLAGNAGHGQAQKRLAEIFNGGLGGIPWDAPEASKWQRLAEAQGFKFPARPRLAHP